MAVFSLQPYLERFPEVCKLKFGRTYDFKKLEREFVHLGRGDRWLTATDISKLFDPDLTPFERYWPRPAEKSLDELLKRRRVKIGPRPAQPLELVNELLKIFHSTGLISIVLRFAHPDQFGIISSPVIHLLQVQRANTSELFIAYCEELEEWRKHFGIASVAETEMALWTFYQLTDGAVKEKGSAQAQAAFLSDIWVERKRMAQVLPPFLKRHGPLELARIVGYQDPNLAGKIAGEEYERLLRAAAKRFYPHLRLDEGWAKVLLDKLGQDGHITLEEKVSLKRVWEVRNSS